MKLGDEKTDSVLIILTVPDHWKKLPVPEIARKLRGNEPHLSTFLAQEIKRWAQTSAVDLSTLQKLIDDRTGKNDQE